MPFCPKCRSEYREGIAVCATCPGGVPLVAELAAPASRKIEPGEETRFVGLRGLVYNDVLELQEALYEAGIASLVKELDLDFPDGVRRFELHVRATDHPAAEEALHKRWREQAEESGAELNEQMDLEACPACGARVPLEVEECPECGLVVGSGVERAGKAPDESEAAEPS